MKTKSRLRTRKGKYVSKPSIRERLVAPCLFLITFSCSATVYSKPNTPWTRHWHVQPAIAQVVEVVATTGAEISPESLSFAGQTVATLSATPKAEPTVEEYIKEVFGADAERAIGVAKCESGLRKNAINKANRNGSVDHGVFQINSVHTKKRGEDFKTDWKANVRVAKQIFDEQGFRPWVCAKAIGETNYLGVNK